jgi:hypothetical protein
MTLLARAAAADVYQMSEVNGALEWIRTGETRHLARPFRDRLAFAEQRIDKWMHVAPLALNP